MKSLLIFAYSVAFFSCAGGMVQDTVPKYGTDPVEESVTDFLTVPGPINYLETEYILSWSDHPTEQYYIQEYLPEGEDLKHFNRMFTIHLFDVDMSISQAVEQKVQELENRKVTDPEVMYKVTKSPEGEEVVLEFFVGKQNDQVLEVLEFDVYHYNPIVLDQGWKAVAIYAYTQRAYGADIPQFSQSFNDQRASFFYGIIGLEKPLIRIQK